VAHQDIDIANPKSNVSEHFLSRKDTWALGRALSSFFPFAQKKSAGFTKEERRDFGQVLDSGFVDTVKIFAWTHAQIAKQIDTLSPVPTPESGCKTVHLVVSTLQLPRQEHRYCPAREWA